MQPEINKLCAANLFLVPIPPDHGKPSKAPRTKGWNLPRAANNPDGYSKNPGDFIRCNSFNFGLYHGASITLALDLDDLALARKVFEELTDFQLLDWLENDQRVEVKSPKSNRGKLLFKLPPDFSGAGLRQLKYFGKVILDLRSGNCQDVVHGKHPEGGDYQLIGNPEAIPLAPPVLLDMLNHWDDWKPCFDSVLGIEQTSPTITSQRPQQGEKPNGWRDPIQAYNQSTSVKSVLLSNGYRQIGKDRFIRPNSESKAPGVVVMHNCADGIERIYSHGGDALNDGFAHDAFDCYRLLECAGDFSKALAWSPEISQHNQQMYRQEQAKNEPEPPTSNQKLDQLVLPSVSPERVILGLMHWDVAHRFTGTPPPRAWLVEGIILMGKASLLAAAGGVGKSYLLLSLAYQVAIFQRSSLLPSFTAFGKLERGGVAVMICAEDDAIEIHNRLAGMGSTPDYGRLMVIPLPDAGGVRPLFEINPHSKAPGTADAFNNLLTQLKTINELALVVLDPLQALCAGLDLNLPQHGQHVCGALAQMAADTGAAVIVSHHLRKGGDIKTAEEARDAIRGSGGLVDGVRSAIAVWPESINAESKTICRRLGLDWQRNRVCKMAVVKANFKADLHIKTLVRADGGMLEDRSFDLYSVTPKPADISDKLLDEIDLAAAEGRPFTKSGQAGIHERRHELSSLFHDWGRDKLRDAVQSLLNAKRLECFEIAGRSKNKVWLGKPDGALFNQSIGEVEDAEMVEI